ncbi:MAG TPA: right-handed parallel beta-helix repeat-containing protein, partial [Actinomycetales bacterium]|nr:right-handed parallel beta-helix repeat-containing protein [Actinomycetales bacterium]
AEVPNSFFGDFNPFAHEIEGDWLLPLEGEAPKHLGDVYLNGRSFYEAGSVDEVRAPKERETTTDRWTQTSVNLPDPVWTKYVWHAQVGEKSTTIWANFHGADPNTELVEINVRRSVFFPIDTHVNFITVRGFEMAHAATPWSPPTADQPGLVGPNWAKGWIIEDNIIHDAKCSAVSLGKEKSTGHNFSTLRGDKPGYQYQLESVFKALEIGWNREHIGSHIVRRNHIYNCGQNAIVGHLGAAFSIIEDNHIHDVANKREFFGHEIGGIKLHAPIDVQISHNRIHNCTLGVWLDWQTQGTRVTRNLFYANTRDIFVEVTHGPYLVDHNVFASPVSLEIFAQGGAYVNNLVFGVVRLEQVLDRSTPYHRPQSTKVAGVGVVFGGDDRFIGNVFLGGDKNDAFASDMQAYKNSDYGTAGYNGCPATFAEYLEQVGPPSQGDHDRFTKVRQTVYIHDNCYANNAKPYENEDRALNLNESAEVSVIDEGESVYLEADIPAAFDSLKVGLITGADLVPVRVAGVDFEAPDGSPVRADVDLVGNSKTAANQYAAGPIANLASGKSRIQIW